MRLKRATNRARNGDVEAHLPRSEAVTNARNGHSNTDASHLQLTGGASSDAARNLSGAENCRASMRGVSTMTRKRA